MSNSGKMWATLAPLCCVEAPIIIINSLCLLKRNNLITRLDAINIENFVMGIRGVSSAWDEDEGEQQCIHKSSSSTYDVECSISSIHLGSARLCVSPESRWEKSLERCVHG
jgi:hypothetical protein